MAQKRKQAIAYGRAGLGALVIGGENNDSFDLVSYQPTLKSYSSDNISVTFFVHGDTEAAFKANTEALVNLQHNSGDFSVTGDTSVAFTNLSYTVSSNELTVTDDDANGAFLDSQLGLPLDIEGVGSFQIKSVTSSDIVVCQLPPELAAPTPASGQSGRIGLSILRYHDASATSGYFGRTSIREMEDPGNSRLRQLYGFDVTYQKPATDSTNDPGGRREASFLISETDAGIQSGVFTGLYTPTKIDDTSSNTARTNFATSAQTWAASVIATLTGAWEILNQSYSEPDENGTLKFMLTYREINFPDTATSTDSSLIRNAFVSFSRSSSSKIGAPIIRPSIVDITYSSALPKSGTTWTQLPTRYKTLIKAHLLSSARTAFGGTAVVISEAFNIFPHVSKIEARMRCFLRGSGSDIIEFSKFIDYGIDPRNDTRDKHDNTFHSYTEFSNGPVITANTVVEVIRIGEPLNTGVAIMAAPQAAAADLVNATNLDVWQVPGPPPFPPALVGNAEWNARPGRVRHSPEFWGYDPDSRSSRIRVTRSIYVLSWLWGNIEKQGLVTNGGGQGGGSKGIPAPGSKPGASRGGRAEIDDFRVGRVRGGI